MWVCIRSDQFIDGSASARLTRKEVSRLDKNNLDLEKLAEKLGRLPLFRRL